MNEKLDITFAIVTYNSATTLRGSLESCLAAVHQYYPTTGRVVIYDNASRDSCPQIIDEYMSENPSILTCIKGKKNLGFAKANNRAIAISPSKVYILVNPDVVFEPSAIPELVATLNSSNDIAIACPKLLYPDASVQPSIRRFPSFSYFCIKQLLGEKLQGVLHPFDYYYAQLPPPQEVVEVNWAIGAFLAVSGDYVERYGLFDERFFLYFEDVSLCVDAWQNGYRVMFQPSAQAIHLYQRASTRSRFNYLRLVHTISALKFFAKYRPYQKRWQIIQWLIAANTKMQSSLRWLIPDSKTV